MNRSQASASAENTSLLRCSLFLPHHGPQGLPVDDQPLSQKETLSVWSCHPELIKTVVPLMMAEILNCSGGDLGLSVCGEGGRGIVNLLEDAPLAFSLVSCFWVRDHHSSVCEHIVLDSKLLKGRGCFIPWSWDKEFLGHCGTMVIC